jgi:hypothetical protein
LFASILGQRFAEIMSGMHVQYFVQGFVLPDIRRTARNSRIFNGRRDLGLSTSASLANCVAYVWSFSFFKTCLETHEYAMLLANASKHYITSHGCGYSLIRVEPLLRKGSGQLAQLLGADVMDLDRSACSERVMLAVTASVHEQKFLYGSIEMAVQTWHKSSASLPSDVQRVCSAFSDVLANKAMPVLRALLGLTSVSCVTLLAIGGGIDALKAWHAKEVRGGAMALTPMQLDFVAVDSCVSQFIAPAGGGKTEVALSHAAFAYDMKCFVVVATKTKKMVRELYSRFVSRRPDANVLLFELVEGRESYAEDSLSLYIRNKTNTCLELEWWLLETFDQCLTRMCAVRAELVRRVPQSLEV